MKYLLTFLVACLIGIGCTDSGEQARTEEESKTDLYTRVMKEGPVQLDEDKLREEVEGLTTDRAKIAFLKEIMTEDQRVRTEETEANQSFGYHSEEHKESIAQMMNMDAQNLQRIDMFTEVYGTPEYNSVGRMQADATWLVVHHSSGTEAHERYFPILYNAWELEMLDGSTFTFYLNRWYEKVSGERHVMEGAYTVEEEVETLMELMDLQPPD